MRSQTYGYLPSLALITLTRGWYAGAKLLLVGGNISKRSLVPFANLSIKVERILIPYRSGTLSARKTEIERGSAQELDGGVVVWNRL